MSGIPPFSSNPIATFTNRGSTRQLFYNIKDYGAVGDGVTDDTTSIQTALNVAGPVGATVIAPPGNYLISSPVGYNKNAALVPQLAPSFIGMGHGGASPDVGEYGVTRLTASNTFPIGEFLIDYVGNKNTASPLVGFTVGGFRIQCSGRAAGLRCYSMENGEVLPTTITGGAIPNPADALGSPTGAFSLVGPADGSYNNVLRDCYAFTNAKDGFHLGQSGGSRVVAYNCSSISNSRYGFNTTAASYLDHCDAQTNTVAGYYVAGASLVDCTELFPDSGNSIILGHDGLSTSTFIGGTYINGHSPGGGSEAANALLRVQFTTHRALFSGVQFWAGQFTSDWIYVDAGSPANSSVQFENCDFNTDFNPLTNTAYNFNGTTYVTVQNCRGVASVGTWKTAASTTALTSLNIPSGTAPTSPNDGDTWYDGTHLKFRIGGTTYQIDQQGGGTVTNASVVTANGISGSVANPTPTPAITLTLGAITPSSIVTTGAVSTGNLTLGTAGNKLSITTGSNAAAGTGTLTGGTVTISTTAVTASSLIFLTDATATLTNVGTLSVSAKSAGVSFTVTSANVLDTSTFNWFLIN